ncbi:MAG: hypothetical protein EBZ59_07995 [Planctomycetia bacterium]|nr:hypothetical protein [Planctomycetia bacterium]
MQLLTFTVAGHAYAIESRRVIEVLPLVPARSIPLAPDYVRGVFTYRGRFLPLVDLARRLADGPVGPPESQVKERLSTRVIVVEFAKPAADAGAQEPVARGPVRLGLVAENVISICSVDDAGAAPMRLEEAPFLGRILRIGGETVQMIEVERLLPPALLAAVDPGTTGGPPTDPQPGDAADLLRRWIGLDPATIGRPAIDRAVRKRMDALGIDETDRFLDRVQTDEEERHRLIDEVIVAESWFFRDPQVFDFTRAFVGTLAAMPGRRPVRILSSPCAGGEEPYSIAMSLLEAGLSPEQFTIDAIDVGHAVLERARRARYSSNAFRNADVAFRGRWFRDEGGWSVLDEAVRSCVRFRHANLLDRSFPAGCGHYDVIFCRNLLIYLTDDARRRVEAVVDGLLAADGLLVLGAAEPPIMKGDWIPAGGHSVFALRRGVHAAHPRRSTAAAPKTAEQTPSRPARPPTGRRAAERPRVDSGAPPAIAAEDRPAGDAGAGAAPDAGERRRSLEVVLHEAGALANAGRFAEAVERCETWQHRHGPSPELFFLLGMIHQSSGDPHRAEACFHKTLYLDPCHEEALLSLALLASQRGDRGMMEHYRRSAARVLARKAAP